MIRCQVCGRRQSALARCPKCGESLSYVVQSRIRADKLWTLIVAMTQGEWANPSISPSTGEVMAACAEKTLTALYGPEPGGE